MIEPFPDMLTERHGTQSRGHSDEGLQAQLEAARDAVASRLSIALAELGDAIADCLRLPR